MDIVISLKSEKAIYQQIYDQIVAQIVNGEIPADYCLPSIRILASELGISVITIKKAWEMLEANEFIYTMAGKGCFVSGHHKQYLQDKKCDLAKQKLREDIPFYKNLGICKEELIRLIEEEYD